MEAKDHNLRNTSWIWSRNPHASDHSAGGLTPRPSRRNRNSLVIGQFSSRDRRPRTWLVIGQSRRDASADANTNSGNLEGQAGGRGPNTKWLGPCSIWKRMPSIRSHRFPPYLYLSTGYNNLNMLKWDGNYISENKMPSKIPTAQSINCWDEMHNVLIGLTMSPNWSSNLWGHNVL